MLESMALDPFMSVVFGLFIGLEVWAFLSPRTFFFVMEGWKYRNVEPSRASLVFLRWQAIPSTVFLWFVLHWYLGTSHGL